jgi:hypothetical protein
MPVWDDHLGQTIRTDAEVERAYRRSRALDWPSGWERQRVAPGVYFAEGYSIKRVARRWTVTHMADARVVRRNPRAGGGTFPTLADAIRGVADDMAKH